MIYAQFTIDRPVAAEDAVSIRDDCVGLSPSCAVLNVPDPKAWRLRHVLGHLVDRGYRINRSTSIRVYELEKRFSPSRDAELFTGKADTALDWGYEGIEAVELCGRCGAWSVPEGPYTITLREDLANAVFTCGPHWVVDNRTRVAMQRFAGAAIEFRPVIDKAGQHGKYHQLLLRHSECVLADEWSFQDGHPCLACGRAQRGFVGTAIRNPDFAYSGEPAAFAHVTRYGSDEAEVLPVFRGDLMAELVRIGGWDAYPLFPPEHPRARMAIEALEEIRKVAI